MEEKRNGTVTAAGSQARAISGPLLTGRNYWLVKRASSDNNGERMNLPGYLSGLTRGRILLWCYAIWYLVNVTLHFDPSPRLWLTSLGLSGIIGTALYISTRSASAGTTELDGWQIFRLYLMPFCVSSFSALVKNAGYILIFPPAPRENLLGVAVIVVFVGLVLAMKRIRPVSPH